MHGVQPQQLPPGPHVAGVLLRHPGDPGSASGRGSAGVAQERLRGHLVDRLLHLQHLHAAAGADESCGHQRRGALRHPPGRLPQDQRGGQVPPEAGRQALRDWGCVLSIEGQGKWGSLTSTGLPDAGRLAGLSAELLGYLLLGGMACSVVASL